MKVLPCFFPLRVNSAQLQGNLCSTLSHEIDPWHSQNFYRRKKIFQEKFHLEKLILMFPRLIYNKHCLYSGKSNLNPSSTGYWQAILKKGRSMNTFFWTTLRRFFKLSKKTEKNEKEANDGKFYAENLGVNEPNELSIVATLEPLATEQLEWCVL